MLFSDVGSELTLPLCRRLGIPTIVSMVHGDVREEQQVLEAEAAAAPDFLPIYLGDGALDPIELTWLHERRLRDLALADRVIVPSDHIAATLVRHGTPRDRLRVIPYAADCRRFHPLARSGRRVDLHVLVRRRDHPAQGNQVSARSVESDPTAGMAAPAPGTIAQPTAVRSSLTSKWSSRWGGSRMPRCPP